MATITLSTQDSMSAAISTRTSAPLYSCFHPDNLQVFEDFSGDERFEIINGFDDASPTHLNSIEQILQFMSELALLTALPLCQQHPALHNHLLEVLVLCKLCIWHPNSYTLTISPFGYNKSAYPAALPPEMRFSLLDVNQAAPLPNTPKTDIKPELINDNSSVIVQEKPWLYTLYRTATEQYIVRVYYSPKSYVDAHMDIALCAAETALLQQDPHWLDDFANAVRKAPTRYHARAIHNQ